MITDDFSRLELSLKAATENYRYFRSLLEPQTKLLVLVKANAYGHGGVEFAAMMQRAGADYLAVAYPVEGLELRRNGISLPILVLTAGTDFYPEIIETRMEPSIPNLFSLKKLVAVLREKGMKDYPIHIKLDTGMHRLGFMESELPELIEYLNQCPEVRVKGLFSHLCVADEPDQDAFSLDQLQCFEQRTQKIIDGIGYRPMRHILNSAGIERFPQYQYDMVRLGIGIYGISALPDVHLAPVASLKVKILQIKQLGPGDTVGYGRWGKAAEGTTIWPPRSHHRQHLYGYVYAGCHRSTLRRGRHRHRLWRRPYRLRTRRHPGHHPLRDSSLHPPPHPPPGDPLTPPASALRHNTGQKRVKTRPVSALRHNTGQKRVKSRPVPHLHHNTGQNQVKSRQREEVTGEKREENRKKTE